MHYLHMCYKLMTLDRRQDFISAQYFDCCTSYLLICNRVMGLDLCQNFVSAQYLDKNGHDMTKLCICIDV